jgi:hypothetical protein
VDILRCSVKKLDCVKMMRDIRNKMVKRYQKSPELEMRELDEIRKKYRHHHTFDDTAGKERWIDIVEDTSIISL